MPRSDSKILVSQLTDIYADYRNVLMSKLYYENRLKAFISRNFWYEVFLAIGTSGTVAGWAIWSREYGVTVWAIIGGAVAIFSVLKPILNYGSEIERYGQLRSHYDSLYYDFQTFAFDLKTNHRLTNVEIDTYKTLRKKMSDMKVPDDPNPSEKLLRECQERVYHQIPTDRLWWG